MESLGAIGVLLLSVFLGILSNEAYTWLPQLAKRLIQHHAACLPSELAERMREEWLAEAEEIPGNIGKLLYALDIFRALPRLRAESLFPNLPYRPATRGTVRIFDFVVAAVGVIAVAPVVVLIALAIKVEDGGPVFYRQVRWGRYKRPFRVYKFRSMVPSVTRLDDLRLTRVGRLLRATSLDELPLLLNILRGEMSWVGPRALPVPLPVDETEVREAHAKAPGFELRFAVRPGLTGIAQVYGAHDVPRRHKFRYDAFYVRRQSFWLNIKLLAVSFYISLRSNWDNPMPRRRTK